MTLWSNMKRYAIYRRLLMSYLILVLLSILLISTVLYQRDSYQTEAEINQSTLTMLDQIDRASNSIHDRAISIGNELLHDPALITAMLSSQSDPLMENEVVIKLSSIQAVYPFIDYISLYNGNTDRYLNYRGITKEMDSLLINKIKSGSSDIYLDFIPRLLDLNPLGVPVPPKPILSFILYSNFSNLIPHNGAIIINIDEIEAIGELSRSLSSFPGSEWMVVDKNGTIISHSDTGLFLNKISHQTFFQSMVSKQSPRGYFTEKTPDGKQLVAYSRSKDTGWVTIGKRPYDRTSGLFSRQSLTWTAVVLLTITGILLAFRLAGRMFRPYSAFQSQQSSLEASWKKAYPLLQESYLRSLLSGKPIGPTGASGTELLAWHKDGGSRYCVIIARIDDYRHFLNRSYKEQELIRFAIRNIADELISPYGSYRTLETDNDHLVILSKPADELLLDRFLLTLVELQQTVRQYFRLSVSFGIGDVVDSEGAIKDSYISAKSHLAYRLFLGHGSIIDRESIVSRIGCCGEYPSKAEAMLLEAVKLGRRRDSDKEVDRFIDAIRHLDYKYAFVYANQLVISVQKQFESSISMEEGDYETHGTLLYSFSEFETLDEIGAALKELCATLIERLEKKRGSRNSEMIDALIKLVNAHYNNPALSLEWAADQVHYSSGHISKLFKQTTHKSFNDFVNTIRLEEAIHLLKETNYSAAVISEKVGLGSTYFFTLFKKTYGMTPAQYRLSLSAGKAAE